MVERDCTETDSSDRDSQVKHARKTVTQVFLENMLWRFIDLAEYQWYSESCLSFTTDFLVLFPKKMWWYEFILLQIPFLSGPKSIQYWQ